MLTGSAEGDKAAICQKNWRTVSQCMKDKLLNDHDQ